MDFVVLCDVGVNGDGEEPLVRYTHPVLVDVSSGSHSCCHETMGYTTGDDDCSIETRKNVSTWAD